MKKLHSNDELSKKLDTPLPKVRRYANMILGPDAEATQQSGKSRKHNLREAFHIYLCAHMITKMGLTMNEVRAILKDISPWLEQNGIYPGSPRKGEPDEIVNIDYQPHEDGGWPVATPWYYPIEIHINRATTPSGFFYRTIKEIPDSRKKKKVKGRQVTQIQFEEGYILPPSERYFHDSLNVYLLKITRLVYDFVMKIEGRQPF